MQLHFDGDVPPRVERLLAVAGDMLEYRRHGVSRNYLDETWLRCPVPEGWKAGLMYGRGTHIRMRVCKHGHVFEVAEECGGASGGFMGSCIPTAFLAAALTAWIADDKPEQLDLFGVAA